MVKKKSKLKKKAATKKTTHRRRTRGCPPGAIPITLTVNPQNQTVTNPNTVHVSKMKKDHVKWQAGKKFTIDFNGPNGSPFPTSHFSGGPGNPACSGTVIGPPNLDYKYTAQILGATEEDPIIHTDP
jgi:hypothetical protein